MGKIFFTPFIALLLYMGKTIIPEIRDNYPLYTNLKDKRKSGTDKVIDISAPATNRNFISNKKTLLKHITLPDEILFISEVKVRDYKYFHFKIKCEALCGTPFFRYDSDGPTHRNYDDNIPFNEQQVTTPHFHRFNTEGVSIAYKTEQLKKEESKKALEDISLCAAHFYHEGNIRVGDDDFPTISILSKTLGLTHTEDDPNTGVNFI